MLVQTVDPDTVILVSKCRLYLTLLVIRLLSSKGQGCKDIIDNNM